MVFFAFVPNLGLLRVLLSKFLAGDLVIQKTEPLAKLIHVTRPSTLGLAIPSINDARCLGVYFKG